MLETFHGTIDAERSTSGVFPPHLLVIEDDITLQAVIARSAERVGHIVHLAASCIEARAIIDTVALDCVTLDLALDDGNGFDIMEQLTNAGYAGPIVVISGAGQVNRRISRQLAKSLGLDLLQSFPKPVDLAALRLVLQQVRERNADRQLAG